MLEIENSPADHAEDKSTCRLCHLALTLFMSSGEFRCEYATVIIVMHFSFPKV